MANSQVLSSPLLLMIPYIEMSQRGRSAKNLWKVGTLIALLAMTASTAAFGFMIGEQTADQELSLARTKLGDCQTQSQECAERYKVIAERITSRLLRTNVSLKARSSGDLSYQLTNILSRPVYFVPHRDPFDCPDFENVNLLDVLVSLSKLGELRIDGETWRAPPDLDRGR